MDEKKVFNEDGEQQEMQIEQNEIAVFNTGKTMWNDVGLAKNAWKMADLISKTSVIPQQYRGKAGDCLISIDIGNRLGMSPIMVMQNSQVVQGNFTWKGAACKALIDGCGKFIESEFVFFGEEGTNSWGCYLKAKSTATGKIVIGTKVTIQMAYDEGWLTKNGSKWKTMPELMLQYRAATFFARTQCPEILMGFMTSEEVKDVNGYESEIKEKKVITLGDCEPEVDDEQ